VDSDLTPGLADHDIEEVILVARGIATAVAPDAGPTDVQAELLEAIATVEVTRHAYSNVRAASESPPARTASTTSSSSRSSRAERRDRSRQ